MSDEQRELSWAIEVREKANDCTTAIGDFEEKLFALAQTCVEMPFSLVMRLPVWKALPEFLRQRVEALADKVRAG